MSGTPAGTPAETARAKLKPLLDVCLKHVYNDGVIVHTPSGLTFRVHVVPAGEGTNDTNCAILDLKMLDPKRGGGLALATSSPNDIAEAYATGVVAGVNHNYLELVCTTCRRGDCPLGDACVNEPADDGDFRKHTVVRGGRGVIKRFLSKSEDTLYVHLEQLLKLAFDLKLCTCKEWFAQDGFDQCPSCLAAVAVGAADSCTICHEPAAKRTRCCKQAMHRACHETHKAHAPPPHGQASCPTCRANQYSVN